MPGNLSSEPPAGSPPDGDPFAREIYTQLHAMARARMSGERTGHTLQPTALVNEVYIRLQGEGRLQIADRAAFFSAAAESMRRILIEHARARGRKKRGGAVKPIPISLVDVASEEDSESILILDETICRLEKLSPQQAQVVRLRFYAGLSVEETAETLGVSAVSVKRAWRYARAWLWREMNAAES